MNDGTRSELIWTLRAEAEESRRLARSLRDTPSVKDLTAYAYELDADAVRAQVERKLSSKSVCNSLKSIVAKGRAASMQAIPKNRRAR